MESIAEHLNKLREERHAREKARIEKLRELNLKKYNKNELPKTLSTITFAKPKNSISRESSFPNFKNNLHSDVNTKRPSTAIPSAKGDKNDVKPRKYINNLEKQIVKEEEGKVISSNTRIFKSHAYKTFKKEVAEVRPNNELRNSRKSFAPIKTLTDPVCTRKSIQPQQNKLSQVIAKPNPKRQSVFERLYQPKTAPKTVTNVAQKLKSDENYLKKVIKNSDLILNKPHSVVERKKNIQILNNKAQLRRSISALHFKNVGKNEMANCIHKWSSIDESLNKVHLKEINEDESVKGDTIESAVKSERKKVKFQTPIQNINTPRPAELQLRLQNWLQKRGKSLDSYHHLQCFGIHHMSQKLEPLGMDKFGDDDDDDKENRPLQSDSDDDSYTDNMNSNDRKGDLNTNKQIEELYEKNNWRRASYVSEYTDFNETVMSQDTTLCSTQMNEHHVDDLLQGALYDLTELLREGFEWEQCARWLRAIRERFPAAPESAAYWECRAALEETRGDLPASVTCWEEAIAKGTDRSVVEANLDQLLDKFMQLKISPSSGKQKLPNPKMVDVKNVFKSTVIRFAVQQAKLRKSSASPLVTVTPVRRSGRLSTRTPLSVRSVKQAGPPHIVQFRNNKRLTQTP